MEETYKNHKIRIEIDSDPLNPRTEFDNVGTMVCFHGRYDLGDPHPFRQSDYNSWDELEADILRYHPGAEILPLYMYDHSGITISTSPFSCPWDSGQIGFIFIPKEKMVEEWGKKRCTERVRALAIRCMKGETEVYDSYLRGDVYGYVVEDADGNELESCWGFIGEYDYCLSEARAVVDSLVAGS